MQTDSEIWSSRKIVDGRKYDRYFPPANGKSTTRIRDAITEETVMMMIQIVKETHSQSTAIANHEDLKGRNFAETLRKIWEFAYWHIQYKLDTDGVEELRTPARAWSDRRSGIDCDCFSIFISSILYNLKIPHSFRITKYGGANWQHVYVIVPTQNGEYILDAVLHHFNQQKPPTQFKDYKVMNVQMLSGLDENGYEVEDSFGKLFKKKNNPQPKQTTVAKHNQPQGKPKGKPLTAKQEAKVAKLKANFIKVKGTVKEMIKHPGKTAIKLFPLAIAARNGFYLFLKVFDKKITSKIRPAVQYKSVGEATSAGVSANDYNNAVDVYQTLKKLVIDKLQGNEDVLRKTIMHTKKGVKGFGNIEVSLFEHWETAPIEDALNGLGVAGVDDAAIATAIAAAIPVITVLLTALKKKGMIGQDVTANNLTDELKEDGDVGTALAIEEEKVLGDGVIDPSNLDPTTMKSGLVDTIKSFATANPLPTALVTGVVVYGLYKLFYPKGQAKQKGEALSGTRQAKGTGQPKMKVLPLL